MSDFALEWNPERGAADVVVLNNDLKADTGLRTAILISLFLDRRAEPGDVLPEGKTDRRGWWADEFSEVPGDKIGSRLWLLERSRETPDVLSRATQYAREALQWLVEDRVCERIEVTAEFLPRVAGLAITISIFRPDLTSAHFRFNRVWAVETARMNS